MSDDTLAAPGCDLSGDMIERLMAALSNAIQLTMNEAFSFRTDIKPWALTKSWDARRPEFPMCAIDIVTADKRRHGTFVLQIDRNAVLKIVALHGAGEIDEGVLYDAVCEIGNMVFGVFKAAVNKMGCRLTMQIPVSCRDRDPLPGNYAAADKAVLPFMAEGYPCHAVLSRA